MKNLYSYLAVLFAGISAGILIAVKWVRLDRVVYNIKRLKLNKSPGGSIQVNTGTLPESGTSVRLTWRQRRAKRKAKRVDKKQGRVIRKNQKKEAKAIDRLEY